MAEAIEQVLADYSVLIAESGTGTGKTFAYLVPALQSGKKVVISTGTKNLQDQLYRRDLPLVRESLGVPVTAAVLKGRANYLCRHRLERTELEGRFLNKRGPTEFTFVREWAGRTRTGDTAELSDVPEDSEIWLRVTSTADNCLGGQCPEYGECFVNRARREALAADVLIINHHLFFADLVLREEGFGQLLPGVEAVIFDEAHQLPEIASNFFGLAVSSTQLLGLCRDTVIEETRERSAVAGLKEAAEATEKAVADMRLAFGRKPRREPLAVVEERGGVRERFDALTERLAKLSDRLAAAAPEGQGLASCHRRAGDLLERLSLIVGRESTDYVRWLETGARTFALRMTPLDVAGPFQRHMQGGKRAWVFTSATLAIGKDFAHFQAQLGLEDAESRLWESPFDYVRQTLLYIPEGLPDPASPDYTARVTELSIPVVRASRGRAFVLFTSHRALKAAAEMLRGRFDYPLLVQGSMPRPRLLERFRAAGNAVLLGTGSFWEGVDVRGDALSCVIIDKLPFAAPDDPVLQARAAALEQAGRSPFMEYQLPNAVIALKQGVGRLIRDANDRGVLMLCDPRLLTKGYGKVFLASLPPMPRTRDIAMVERFFVE